MSPMQFLTDKKADKLSASRLLLLLWGVGVLVTWIIASVMGDELEDIPNSVVTILGILISGKTVQRFGEN